MAPPRRKHSTLTLKDKVRIIEMIDKGDSYPCIARKFDIGRSTVGDIKKNKDKILKFVSHTERGPGVRKTLKKPENPTLDDALFTWFLQQRRLHVPISGDMICEKARIFHRQITNSSTSFNASRGWLDNFKKRHGIRRLKMAGEKLSSDEAAIGPFQHELQKVIREKNLTAEQIYNADESGLYWRLLPDHTLASGDEQSASGRKMMKMRITFMPCANAAGTHKLQLLVVGKAKNPRAFKSTNLPICYRAQKNTWVTKDLFLECFKMEFVPAVRRHLLSVNLPTRALLLLDNCPGHPSAEELITEDGNIFAMFLPPNTTACIQPMDQNVIQNVKQNYRKSLLIDCLANPLSNENLANSLKCITLKDTVFNLANCWAAVKESLIKKSWKNLCPQLHANENFEPEDDIPLAELINR